MRLLQQLRLTGLGRRLPLILQTESAECGLACLAMIAGYHGYQRDLTQLRREFSLSLKGATLADLISVAGRMKLATRPLKLPLASLNELTLPCVLHWDFNHFVVLREVSAGGVVIHDPGHGVRRLSMEEVSRSFTGIALEAWPNPGFAPEKRGPSIGLRRLVGPVSSLSRPLAEILVLAVVLELLELMSPLFMQWVVDEVLVAADRDLLGTLVIGFGMLVLMRNAVGALRSWLLVCLGATLGLQWKSNVFSHLLRLPVQYFEKRHLGDIVSRFESIEDMQRILTSEFVEAILDGLMTAVTLTMMFIYSPMLAIVATAAAFVYMGIRHAFYNPLYAARSEEIIHQAKQNSHFIESVRGAKTIKLFQRQTERHLGWVSLAVDETNAQLRVNKLQIMHRTLNKLLFGLENILVVWLGASAVMAGSFTAGALLAFIAYKDQFGARVTSLIDKYFDLRMLRVHTDRLGDIVLSDPEKDGAKRREQAASGERVPDIEVRNVSFRYADGEPYTLYDVSLRIEAGESVAIIGPSGSGKSTLANIMLGILPPTEGDVVVGGMSLRDAGPDAIRSLVGVVMQDDVLFAGSIGDNISFFDPKADRAQVEACARMAAVHDDIMAMPMQYDTLVGDMGTVLSGGQKQRVLLARALYKKPSILVLDEATSALDVQCEAEVNSAIRSMNITRVIIAHRPETIRSADRTILLVDGEVVDPDEAGQPETDGVERTLACT